MNYEGPISEDRFEELLAMPRNSWARRFMQIQFGDQKYWRDPSSNRIHGQLKIVIALEGAKVLGFFRYSVHRNKFLARGTWVLKQERRKGLGSHLWQLALCSHPGSLRLDVSTTSREGNKLVRSMLPKFEHVDHYSLAGGHYHWSRASS